MNNKKLLLVTLSLVSVSAFAAQERVIKFENQVRLGHDDNIYQTEKAEESGFITEIVKLTGTFNFSSRSDLVLYWQPELRYRFDGDPEVITYQDVYARLNHAISQRAFLQISDRLRYQEKEGSEGGVTDVENQNYVENNLLGALDITVDSLSQLSLGGGYEFRIWDDEEYGQSSSNADYDRVRLNATYVRELKPDTTQGELGIDYDDLSYDGSRGGYESVSVFGGAVQNFSPNLTGTARLGASFNETDYRSRSSDSTTPYLQTGLRYKPTEQTSVNGSLGYSLSRAQSSNYSAQEQLSFQLGVSHNLTAKIKVSSTLGYTLSSLNADYSDGTEADKDVTFLSLAIRGSYQINRNNFVEAGYQFSDRGGDLTEYERNQIDFGWRVQL